MKTLIIDPGHGGTDSGATAFQTKEKDWNLKMSLYQYKRLKALGAKVALSRSTDESLSSNERITRIKNKYDVCLSNHFNAFNSNARGIETIYSTFANGQLATTLADALKQTTGLPLRRVFSRKNNQGTDWYYMHRLTGRTETVIIEYGFMDHVEDFNYYNQEENFFKAAESVVKVICQYLGIAYKVPQNKKIALTLPSDTPLYRVQVGAFVEKENAEKEAYRLKKLGFDAVITN